MGGSKSPDYPEVEAAPKARQIKNVTEAAAGARTAQMEKARKARGLRGSILTSSPLAGDAGSSGAAQKTLLGQ